MDHFALHVRRGGDHDDPARFTLDRASAGAELSQSGCFGDRRRDILDRKVPTCIGPGLLRLSVGIEHVEGLLADLLAAIERVAACVPCAAESQAVDV
ncbi:MAG TPA: hypothetical protein EYP98_13115 [Planctomycetes bacterium]|nr:hypothetical protein [Planctomycetota bacterium]